MLKKFLLKLSKSHRAEIVFSRHLNRASRKFIAGESIESALDAASHLASKGFLVAFDHLGENVKTRKECQKAVSNYISLIKSIGERDLKGSSVSVKLTQVGLDIDYDYCLSNARKIAAAATKTGIRMEIDMEGSRYTNTILDAYRELRKEFDAAVCVQAYLYRTSHDVKNLLGGAKIRIVKGAYGEGKDIALIGNRIERNFIRILEDYITPENVSNNLFIIGTHNSRILFKLDSIIKERGIDKSKIEIEMLYGVRDKLKESLLSSGYKVRVYLPYGEKWYPYFMRRLAERPSNAWLFFRNLF